MVDIEIRDIVFRVFELKKHLEIFMSRQTTFDEKNVVFSQKYTPGMSEPEPRRKKCKVYTSGGQAK
jgi:hypothetical protein